MSNLRRLISIALHSLSHKVSPECPCYRPAWSAGFYSAAKESDRREFLIRSGFSQPEIEALSRVEERAA